MRITWVTRSFPDYRVPVYQALDELCGHQLTLIYNGDVTPQRCKDKVRDILGDRAIPLFGEKTLSCAAYNGIRIPFQKGLIKEIRKSKPEVLVSDDFFHWTYATLWVRLFNLKGIRHVMCYELTPLTGRNSSSLSIIYRKLVSRWIDSIDCNGSQTAEYVTKTLGYKRPLAYGHTTADTESVATSVANTTDCQVEAVKSRYGLGGLTFLYIGQLIPRMGLMELLQAWKSAKLADATLMIVGDGCQRAEIERYVADNALDGSVKIVENICNDDLGPYFRAADCFITPSLEDNWGIAVPQAMEAALPIACSVYNGCHPELVRPENGWTFEPLNTESTMATLKEISRSRDRLKSMGLQSRKLMADRTPQHAAQGIYDTCLKVLEK